MPLPREALTTLLDAAGIGHLKVLEARIDHRKAVFTVASTDPDGGVLVHGDDIVTHTYTVQVT